ncbi:MAG: hypothetical protein ACM3PY_12215 [Omnitrophica WOR_2 bacterium]
MKIVKWLLLLNGLILAIILAACQPATTTVHPPIDTTTTSGQSQSNSYPAPAQPAAQNVANTPYPEPPAGTQATTITWSDAQSMIINAQIAKVIQAKSLEVTLYTKDARLFKTTEPALDDVLKVIEQCGTDCKVIKVVN